MSQWLNLMDAFVLVATAFFLVQVHRKFLACPAQLPVEVGVLDRTHQVASPACPGPLAFRGFQVDVAKGHPTEMCCVGDTAVGTGERGKKGNTANDHDEVLCLQRKQHVHVQNAVGKREAISKQY